MAAETPLGTVAPPRRLWHLPSWLLTHVAGRSHRLVLDHFGTVTARTHYAVLAALDEFGPISQANLGRRVGLDRSDVVAVLDQLQHGGLVTRAPDEYDRRRNAVAVTASGSKALRTLDERANGAQKSLLEPLTPDERRQFTVLLQRLLEHHTAFRSPDSSSE